MTIRMKNTLHGMMVATVAGSILLTGCGPSRDEIHQPRMGGELVAPKNNPKFAGEAQDMPEMADMRVPEGNVSADVGAEYEVAEMQEPYPQPQQPEPENFFTSLLGGRKEAAVDTSQRRVPVLNKEGGEQPSPMETASYEAAAPVEQVIEVQDMEMGANAAPVQAAPQSEIIVAEEVAALDEPFAPRENATLPKTYPSLATVPPRPERIEAVQEKDARMADLADARSGSAAQQQALEAQVAQEKEGSLLPQQQSANDWQQPVQVAQPESQPAQQQDIEAEFAALVAAEQPKAQAPQEAPAAAQPPAAEAAQAQPWDVPAEAAYQAPAPIEMAHGQPQVTVSQAEPVQVAPQAEAPQPVIQSQDAQQQAMPTQWQAAPQVAPQNTVPVQEDQWVSLQQDPAAQMAAPVEGVTVDGAPEVVAVSPIPVVPEGGAAAGGIELTPPSAYGRAVRTLPESRYAARRQAVYMQRYARQVQANEGFQ